MTKRILAVAKIMFVNTVASASLIAIAVVKKTQFSMLSKEKISNGGNNNIKRKIFIIFVFLLFLLIFIILILNKTEKTKTKENGIFFNQEIMVKNNKIFVAIADNPITRERGLSEVSRLEENQGMLFLFNEPGIYNFWMKDMKFDIDLIWIHNNKIVEITENVPAPDNPENLKVYFPSKIINSVLEVNAGWAQRNKIEVGDEIQTIKK